MQRFRLSVHTLGPCQWALPWPAGGRRAIIITARPGTVTQAQCQAGCGSRRRAGRSLGRRAGASTRLRLPGQTRPASTGRRAARPPQDYRLTRCALAMHPSPSPSATARKPTKTFRRMTCTVTGTRAVTARVGLGFQLELRLRACQCCVPHGPGSRLSPSPSRFRSSELT